MCGGDLFTGAAYLRGRLIRWFLRCICSFLSYLTSMLQLTINGGTKDLVMNFESESTSSCKLP